VIDRRSFLRRCLGALVVIPGLAPVSWLPAPTGLKVCKVSDLKAQAVIDRVKGAVDDLAYARGLNASYYAYIPRLDALDLLRMDRRSFRCVFTDAGLFERAVWHGVSVFDGQTMLGRVRVSVLDHCRTQHGEEHIFVAQTGCYLGIIA